MNEEDGICLDNSLLWWMYFYIVYFI